MKKEDLKEDLVVVQQRLNSILRKVGSRFSEEAGLTSFRVRISLEGCGANVDVCRDSVVIEINKD